MKEPKVTWVKSWRDIPSSEEAINPTSSDILARYVSKEKMIYAIKGKTSPSILEHEKYHAMKAQTNGVQKDENPSSFIAEELEADRYAYEKTGKPHHIKQTLRALVLELWKARWFKKVPPSKALSIIEKQLIKVKPPLAWLEDYKSLMDEAHSGWQKYKNNPKSLFYLDVEPKIGRSFSRLVSVDRNRRVYGDEERSDGEGIELKKPKNMKNWWDDTYYENKPLVATHSRRNKTYGEGRLLPPDLGGKL